MSMRRVVGFGGTALRATFLAAIGGAVALTGCGDDINVVPDAPPIDAPDLDPAALAITPETSDLGSVQIGETGTASFTVTNMGEDVSGTISAVVTGANAGEFSAQNGCSTLNGGDSCTVTVTFAPTSAGSKMASLVVNGSPGGSVSSTLTGLGNTPGSLAIVGAASQSLGSVVVGGTSATNATFTIRNDGSAATGNLLVTPAGSDPGEFTLVTDDCDGTSLAGGDTCDIVIAFEPASAGPKSASFTVSGNPGGNINASVSGTGLAPARLVATPTLVDFATVTTGTNSATATVNVTNAGGVATSAISQALSGINGAQFDIASGNCDGATLAPGASCTLTVRFSPDAGGVGPQVGQLDITAATGGSAAVTLLATGATPGAVAVTPSPAAFGDVNIGSTSASQTLTVTNGGGSTTSALNVALGGTDPSQFTIVAGSNGCQGVALGAGSTCTVAVQFTPNNTTGGSKSATLTVTTSTGSASGALTGNAVAPAALSIDPASRDFGSVVTNTNSAALTFTVTNNGGVTSATPVVAVNGTNASEFTATGCTTAIAAGGNCTVSVVFRPTSQGPKSATVSVTAGATTVSGGLSGNGIQMAQIVPNPTVIAFPGFTVIGESATAIAFTVTNQGSQTTGPLTITPSGDFTETNNCTTLVANAQCTVIVTFTPTAAGTRTGNINVSATPGGSFAVALSGVSRDRLEIRAPATNPFAFPDTSINVNAAARPTVTVTIRNNDDVDLELENVLTNINATVSDVADFDIVSDGCTNNAGADLDSLEECNIVVAFDPNSAAALTAALQVRVTGTTDAQNRTIQNFTGSGSIQTLVIRDTDGDNTHVFAAPAVEQGLASAPRVFTIENQSSSTTGVLSVELTNSANFSIALNNCSGDTLTAFGTAGDSCTVEVTFIPSNTSAQSATLTVRSTSVGTTQGLGGTATATVSGTGTAAVATFSPNPLAFGDSFAGTNDTAQLTVRNPNDNPTTITWSIVDDAQTGQQFTRLAASAADTCGGTGTTGGTFALAAGTTCVINVQLVSSIDTTAPGTFAGPRTGTLNISESFGGNSDVIDLTANVLSSITSSTPAAFTDIAFGTSATRTVTITNASGTSVGGFAVAVCTAGSVSTGCVAVPGYSVTNNTCTTLASGTCTFDLTFSPPSNTTANVSGVLVVSATNGRATATITGNQITAAQLSGFQIPSGSTIDFGSVPAGQQSSTRTITVSNSGQQTTSPLTVTTAAPFSVVAGQDTCTGATLAQNATCSVTVRYTAGAGAGNSLVIAGAPFGGTFTLSLVGAVNASNPVVTVTPTSVQFPNTTVNAGATGPTQTFTVQNTSTTTAATIVNTIAGNPDFVISSTTCGPTLAFGASCTVTVRFATGGTSGNRAASLTVVTGLTVGLQGRALTAANTNVIFSVDPPGLFNAFGDVVVNTTSSKTITLQNIGETTSPTGLTNISFVGADAPMFTLTANNCATMVAPGATCSFVLNFRPTTTGPKSAAFNFTIDGVTLTSATLTGTGVDQAALSISPSAAVNFGSKVLGSTVAAPITNFTFGNNAGSALTGNVTVSIAGANPGDFVIVAPTAGTACFDGVTTFNGQFTIAAGTTCTVGVSFQPDAVGTRTASVVATATPGATVSTAVSGVGAEALVLVTPASPTSFGASTAGTIGADVTFTFRNDSSSPTSVLRASISGPPDFTIAGTNGPLTDDCSGRSLAPAATCQVTVQFTPSGAAGARTGTLTVAGQVGGAPTAASAALTGTVN